MHKSPDTSSAAKAEKEPLKIERAILRGEIEGFSHLRVDSSHGTIEDTKALKLEVSFNRDATFAGLTGKRHDLIVLLAQYSDEPIGGSDIGMGGAAPWQVTDIKALVVSARYKAQFRLADRPWGTVSSPDDDISDIIEELLIDEHGKLKELPSA